MPRYITIPKAQLLPEVTVGEGTEQRPLALSFAGLHNLGIWASPDWLKSTDAAAAQAECREALESAEEGEVVAIPDDHFAIYQPIALKTQPALERTSLLAVSQLVGAARVQLLAPLISPPTKPPVAETGPPTTDEDESKADEPAE